MPALRAELAEQVLVAHNKNFDVRMVEQELATALNSSCCPMWSWLPNDVLLALDTCALDYRVSKPQKGFKLGESAVRWGVELNGAHRAVGDAECCGRILQKMIDKKAIPLEVPVLKEFCQTAEQARESLMARLRRR
jgi:DNA polymerase III alpha subunit (gram-positive type)